MGKKKKKLVKEWLVFLVVGQRQSSMMPFTLEELILLSRCLRDACLGIIKLAYPETRPEVREEYITAFQSIGVTASAEMQQCIQVEQKRWVQLFKVHSGCSTCSWRLT
jgi:ubiquitin-protein ligase E3 C